MTLSQRDYVERLSIEWNHTDSAVLKKILGVEFIKEGHADSLLEQEKKKTSPFISLKKKWNS